MLPAHCAATRNFPSTPQGHAASAPHTAKRSFPSAPQAMLPAHCAATRNFPSTPQGRAATHRAQRSGVFPPRRRAMLPAHCAETRSFPSAPQGHAASVPRGSKAWLSLRAVGHAASAPNSGQSVTFSPRRRPCGQRTARQQSKVFPLCRGQKRQLHRTEILQRGKTILFDTKWNRPKRENRRSARIARQGAPVFLFCGLAAPSPPPGGKPGKQTVTAALPFWSCIPARSRRSGSGCFRRAQRCVQCSPPRL